MPGNSIRLYVRTKKKYETANCAARLFHTDVTDFAGTSIKDIKEACHKRTGAKIDELFYHNQPLADDRSVAHYNLPNNTILETTSNPLWVAMIHVKMIEIERARDASPDNPAVQRWTHRSYIRKVTLLSVLFNAKKERDRQPPNFATCEDFIQYIENLGKKGAAINRRYSGRDFERMFNEYLQHDVDQPDPLRSFQAREAARLGLNAQQDEDEGPSDEGQKKGKGKRTVKGKGKGKQPVKRVGAVATPGRQAARQNAARLCEDCEQNVAEVYCGNCTKTDGTPGVLLCLPCTDFNHRGALRRGHDCKDISEAPRAPREPHEYCPHPYKAPFAILLAMTRALTENHQRLSLDEDEIKKRAQPLTDTDLYDKQAGKVMGGFDCIENSLLPKKLLQKEASGRHTFALTQAGTDLGQKLDLYDQVLQRFLQDSGVPHLPSQLQTQVDRQRLCLVIDENERDRARLRSLADTAGINLIVRRLPVADYVWVLAPELEAGQMQYNGNHPEMEIMLPVLVERKSWNDYHDTVRFDRWGQQIRKMKACGLQFNFVLLEGNINDLRNVSEERKEKLKFDLEELCIESGFHICHTFCWSKSAAWLLWMTHQLADAYSRGLFSGEVLFFSELQKKMSQGLRQMRAGHTVQPIPPAGPCVVWSAEELVTAIFRQSLGEKTFEVTCRETFRATGQRREMLVVNDMELYNKGRHTLLYNCLRLASSTVPLTRDSVAGVIEEQLMPSIKGLVHYDVTAYWLLFLQINFGVYVMMADSEEDAERFQEWFSLGRPGGDNPGGQVLQAQAGRPPSPERSTPPPQVRRASATVTRPTSDMGDGDPGGQPEALPLAAGALEEDDFATDSQTEERMMQEALSLSLISSLTHDQMDISTPDDSTPCPSTSGYQPPPPTSPRLPSPASTQNDHCLRVPSSPPVPTASSVTASSSVTSIGASLDDAILIDSQDSQQADREDPFPAFVDTQESDHEDCAGMDVEGLNAGEGGSSGANRIQQTAAGSSARIRNQHQGLDPLMLTAPSAQLRGGRCVHKRVNGPDIMEQSPEGQTIPLPDRHQEVQVIPPSPTRKRTTVAESSVPKDSNSLIPGKKSRKTWLETDKEIARRLQEELNSESSAEKDSIQQSTSSRLPRRSQGMSSGSPHKPAGNFPVFVDVEDSQDGDGDENLHLQTVASSHTSVEMPVPSWSPPRSAEDFVEIEDSQDILERKILMLSEDEALARKLQEEEDRKNGDRQRTQTPDAFDSAVNPFSRTVPSTQLSGGHSGAEWIDSALNTCDHTTEDDEALAKILQLEEEEHQRKLALKNPSPDDVLDDEQLAKKLQEEEERNARGLVKPAARKGLETPSTMKPQSLGAKTLTYRKLFKEENTQREKMTSQLEEYRKLQEQRFKAEKLGSPRKPPAALSPEKENKGVFESRNQRRVKAAASPKKSRPAWTESSKSYSTGNPLAAERRTPKSCGTGFADASKASSVNSFSPTAPSTQSSGGCSGSNWGNSGASTRTPGIAAKISPSLCKPSTAKTDTAAFDSKTVQKENHILGDSLCSSKTTDLQPCSSSSTFSKASPRTFFVNGDMAKSAKCDNVMAAGVSSSVCNDKSKLFDSDSGEVSITGVGDDLKEKTKGDASAGENVQAKTPTTSATKPLCNITCGNCGQKGHSRTFVQCPNYYTAEEQARRDAKLAEQRRRAEERAREAEERLREEERALQSLKDTRNQLQQNKDQMMAQIAAATQQCASQFDQQLGQIDLIAKTRERKVKAQQKRQQKKQQ